MTAPAAPAAPAAPSAPAVQGAGLVHLRRGGVSLLLDARGPGQPAVLHWGAALPELGPAALLALAEACSPPVAHSALDVPVVLGLLPERSAGYRGRPGLSGSRVAGGGFSPRLLLTAVARDAQDGADGVVVTCADPDAGLEVRTELLLAEGGLLRARHTLRNTGADAYRLGELAVVLPLPGRATELLDLTGRHCRERSPQRHPLPRGAWVREARHGRTGHDATLALIAGVPGFTNRGSEVWSVHLGWSGDSVSWAERLPGGQGVLAAAELLGPGEVELAPGTSYATPWVYAAASARGLDGLGDAHHHWLRSRPTHPRTPRPVVLNTWEAVYFDHDLTRLTELADVAAETGVERFVLDDGWFLGRRHDSAGLGDWIVDPGVWPDGLAPLIDHVRARGMAFGLWVEPEMVNIDSEVVRAHPEWVLRAGDRLPLPWRHQQVLDLVHPDAYAHVLAALDALLRDHDIAYLKWDQNRDLTEMGHDGAPAVHAQTLAVYRLLDELRARHPDVEIESCSSGGARVDLGILERTDRVWASDTNDALERQMIQRWTGLLVPPELVGAHVGPPRSHTTGRTHDLSFRLATALFGHLGIEWDIAGATDEDRAALRGGVAAYKELRALLHTGAVVHADHHDPSAAVHGVVAVDGSAAVFAFVQLTTSVDETPGLARLPGLDPDRDYRVEPLAPAGAAAGFQRTGPSWLTDGGGIVLRGDVLDLVGLAMPILHPEQALLLRLTAV